MHSHVVQYKSYPGNPAAAEKIIREANRLISAIPGIHAFHAAPILKMNRAVTTNEYDVLMNIIFTTSEEYARYVSHENHVEFARFMLNGYMLQGTAAENPTEEFIDYVLHAGQARPWIRNPAIPDREVVWAGENGFDAAG